MIDISLFTSQIQAASSENSAADKSLVDDIQDSGGFRDFVEKEQEKTLFLNALQKAADSLLMEESLSGLDFENLSVVEVKEQLRARLGSEKYMLLIERVEELIRQEIEDALSGEADFSA